MFAALAKFRRIDRAIHETIRLRRSRARNVRLVYSNSNRPDVQVAVTRHALQQPRLVCRWQSSAGGGLECRWVVARIADGPDEVPEGISAGVMSEILPALAS